MAAIFNCQAGLTHLLNKVGAISFLPFLLLYLFPPYVTVIVVVHHLLLIVPVQFSYI